MGLQLVEFDERAGVEEDLEPLPGGVLSLGVLLLDPLRPAPELGLALEVGQAGPEAVVVMGGMVGHGSLSVP